MKIKHILKNGAVLDDITGQVIQLDEIPKAYEVMNQINDQISNTGGDNEQKAEKK